MDLSRIKLITDSSIDQLKDIAYVENLIIKLGFNTQCLDEQPQIVKNNTGGLLIWQYPNQFSKYLSLIKNLNISSYLEIGCRWGGTFVLTNEYLNKFHPLTKSVAVDIIDSPVDEYCKLKTNSKHSLSFMKLNSTSQEFKDFIAKNYFDIIFIDGDHTYQGVKSDYEACKNSGKIFVFHDIVNGVCPGVVRLWKEIKQNEYNKYNIYEFIEQYDEVVKKRKKTFLGIGVAVKK